MKKLLFLTSRLPYPTSSGRKNVMFYYCKYLKEMYGYEIINVSFLESDDDVSLKPDFISKTYVVDKPLIKEKLKNLFEYTIIKNKLPMQVSLFLSESAKKDICRIIDIEKPDLVMCDMVRMAEYLKDTNIPKILDMDDLLSIRYKRQLELDLKDINPYGSLLYSIPRPIRNILTLKNIKKIVLKKETKLLEKYEIKISKIYDSVVFVAQKEADEMNKKLGVNKSFAVPLGVDIEYFNNADCKDNDKIENSLSFMGAMSVAHNETAVIWFIEKIMPLIQKEIEGIKFFIIGGGVTQKVRRLCENNDNIIITGRVSDIRQYIKRTCLFVSPLLFGSGIKTKNLEAMAMKVPVITTTIGAESINVINNKDCIIKDNEIDFANKVIELLKNEDLRTSISENGFEFIEKNFRWDNLMKKWKVVIEYTKNNYMNKEYKYE